MDEKAPDTRLGTLGPSYMPEFNFYDIPQRMKPTNHIIANMPTVFQ